MITSVDPAHVEIDEQFSALWKPQLLFGLMELYGRILDRNVFGIQRDLWDGRHEIRLETAVRERPRRERENI